MGPGRPTRRRRAVVAAGTVLLLAASGLTWWNVRSGDRGPPRLLTSASWRDPDGAGADGAGSGRAVPSRDGAARLTAAQRVWLSTGTVPGRRWRSMNRWALVDLRQLTRADGAMSAGAASFWSYAWPRDMAFGAAALARTGHLKEAWSMIAFLSRVQEDDGGFEARYLLDGSGPPDGRQAQSDGAGWALWATAQVLAATTDPSERAAGLAGARPLIDRCVANLLRHTESGTRLPEPSPDYWEVREREVTLGLVGPMLAGLRSATSLYRAAPDAAGAGQTQADRIRVVADRFEAVVHAAFGPGGYQRYRDHGGPDASVTFLMPPFTSAPHAGVTEAWLAYQVAARRPAGGLAPGAGWRQDGVSWTPEVGLVAYTAAASGHRRIAVDWLDWLDQHRAAWGSLPEKVLADGSPAGPAPLSWTAAAVLLASAELDEAAN